MAKLLSCQNIKSLGMIRNYSKLPPNLVAFVDDRMVVCWHPEQPFPYECSKPIQPKAPEPVSAIKNLEEDVQVVFRKDKPLIVIEELAKKTYTCKQRWFPIARAKKNNKPLIDRPFL